MKILHLAAHMGGGIGSAYTGLGVCGMRHTIVLLEKPIDKASLAKVEAESFQIIIQPDLEQLKHELEKADIVLFNWSHHPALTKLLVDFPESPIRSVLWCHVSGNYFPHIHSDFLRRFDHVLFATPYSLSLAQIQDMGENYINEHFKVVYGLGDLGKYCNVKLEPKQDRFVIGYVGTLGYSKLHPNFIDFCASVDIPNVEFAMVGSPTTKDEILKAAEKKGIADRFVFYGQVSDVTTALSTMNVFGYILNPQHFGATENALLEAMAAGLPVVAIDQNVENVIIKNGETGLLVKSPQTYGAAIKKLHDDNNYSVKLGYFAKKDVLERFNTHDNRNRFKDSCNRLMAQPKRTHVFRDFFGETPADWFLSCVNQDKDCFLENRAQDAGIVFKEKTKGTPAHYHNYFPEDSLLTRWKESI